ncbi:MAG: Ig-like domain-containing protein, partial [Betaproteobacteria bacterium]|nr:Ig-like domain-containing protein [Betaproteobacteria bacterium]
AAGNDTVVERSVTLAARPLATITRATPDTGIDDVGVTFRPQITFSRAVDVSTLTAESFYATGPGGQKLAATIVPSKDASFAWLFFDAPMPGGAVITVHVNGDLIRATSDGSLLDADGNGQAGGGFTHRFTTASTASIPPTTVTGTDGTPVVIRTSLVGKVVDPGADLEPMTFDDMRRGPDGVIHTADDVFLNPIAHAKVWILGLEDRFVYTDAQGTFELLDVPAGTVKLAIDGRTATNAPAGTFWPEMVMDLVLEAGAVNTAMGTMGSREERAANADRREVYLPRLPQSILQDVSATQDTVIGVDAAAAPNLSEAQRAQLQLVVEAGSLVDEHGNVLEAGQVGISTVPPELVRDMLPPGVLQHTFDITIQAPGVAAFNTPLKLTMPNTFGAAPGEKVNFLSFDHTTGRLVIEGTATVSADGLTITTDPGQGITKPGWHGWTPRGSRLSAGLLPALLPGDFEGGMNLPPDDTDFSDGDGSDPRVLATFKAPERDPLLPEDQQPYLVITIEPDGNAGAYLKETAGSLLPITGGSIRLNAGDPRTYEFGVENLPLADVTAPSGGKGIASFATNVLFTNAFKIAKTLVEPGKGENGSTRSTTEEKTSHVGRYIDATDDRVDTTIRFSDTLADGSVSRTKNIQFVSGFASAPVSATLSGSSDFQESFSGGGVTLTFDPSAVHSAGASLQIVTPGSPGGAPNRTSIALNGVGTAPYQVAVDRTSLDTMLLSIFIEKTPVLNPLDDSVVPELETVAGRQQVINDVIARVGQYYAGFDGISVVGAQSPAISARTIAAYAKATNARPFNPSAAQTLGAAPLDLEIAPLVANVFQTNNGLSSAQRMFLMDSYINNEGAGHPGYLHHDAFAVYEALVNESPGNLLDTPSHDELVNALAENIAHEAGHTLGLVHANGIFPGDIMAQGTDPDGTKTFTNSTAATLRMALNLEYTTADANSALSLLVTRYNVTGGQLQDNLPDDIPLPVPTPVAEVPVPLLQDTQDGAAVFGEIDLGALIADGPGGSATTRSFDLLNFGSGDLVVKSVRVVDGDGAVRLSGFAGGDVIAFGERQTFTLSFDPLAPVDLDARLIVETDGPAGTVEYRLTGSAQTSSGYAALEARNNAAGGLAVGSVLEQAQAYVLENRGATPLTITGLRTIEGGGQFSLTGLPANLATTPLQLAAGASLDIGLRYTASKAGLERGIFELTTNDPLHPLLRLTVSGTGIAAGELVDWGSDYVMLQTGADGAGVVRLVSEDDGGFEFFGPADGRYTVLIFDPATGLVARGQGTTPASGGQKDITGSLVFRGSQGTDTDGDGLTDEIESILGLAPGNTDSDRDGIDDFRELALGLDPLDGRVARTGVIGSLALPGEAKAVALAGPLDGGTGQTVFVATGTHGLAIVNVSPDNVATLVGQIDLPGNAVDVSIDAALGVAAIASGSGGLHRVDISDISAPRLLETHAINASQVEVHQGVIYAAVGTELRAYDLLTGEKLAAVVTSSRISALEREGDTLFTLDATRALTAYDIGDGTFDRRGSLSIPGSPVSLFVGGGVAYIGAAPDARSQGFSTVDVSNPSAMILVSGADDPTVITGTLAANGSGLLISGGRIAGPSGLIQAVDVMNVRDLSDTQTRIARFTLGDAPVDIAIGGGLAFIAAGRSDLQIVSYLGSDMQGLAPVLSADGAALDVDPLADGIQVQEGSTVQLPVTVADDQQVASVELLLNGRVVRADTGFPFELSAQLPTLAANGGRTTVTLQVRATDTGGNVGLAPPVTVTLVPDTVGPVLVESSIEEGDEKSRSLRSITLLFSEALDAATVNGATVQLIGPDGNAVPDPQVQFRQKGREVQLTWAPLPAVGSYRFVLEAGAITDRAGNPLGTAAVETAFTVQNYSTEWIGPAGGFWDVAANWSEGTVPTADDDVFVGGLPDGAGITFRTGSVTVATLTGEARILLTGGALTVAGELRLDDGLRITGGAFNAPTGGNVDGVLELAGGTLTVDGSLDVQSLALSGGTLTGSGSINVAADSTWTGGAVTGTGTLSFLGDLSISGAASKVLTGGRVVNTLGTTTWAGATTANTNDFFTGPATIHNAGTWIDANVATTIVRDWYAGDAATFDNTGTYRKTGAGTSTLQMKFDNRGTIRVEAGVLSLDSGGVSGAEGAIDIAAGATLRFGGGEFHLEDAVVTGPGTLQVAGTFNTTTSVIHTGTTTLAGQLSLVGGTLFANGVLNAASYAQAANYAFLDGTGVVDVAGAATWSDGNMQGTGTIRFRGDLAISGAGDKAVSGGRIIETFGTTTWRGATVANTNDFYTGPGMINNAGTWIDDNAFDTIVRDWYSGEPLVFNNSGTYRKSGGSTSTLQIAFRNTGRIEVEGGILSLQSGGGTTGEGAIDIDAGATLRLSGGEHRLEGTPVSGTGRLEVAGTFNTTTNVIHTGTTVFAGQLSLIGGTLTANGTLEVGTYAQTANYAFLEGSGVVDVAGAATWSDGNMDGTGTIHFRGDLAISGAGDKALTGGRSVHTYGATTWRGATGANNNDFYTGPATFTNHGTFVDDNAFNTIVRDWFAGDPARFVNLGTYRKTSATVSRFEWTFDNQGTMDLDAGTVLLVRGGTNSGGIDLASGAVLQLASGDVAWNEGTAVSGVGRLLLNGAELTVNADIELAHIDLAGGTLTGSATVALTGTGSTWTSGFMTGGGTTRILADADLTLSGSNRKYLGARILDLQGTLVESSTGDLLDLEGAATLNLSGLLDIRGDTAWQDYSSASGSLALTVADTGIIRKSAGAGQFEFLHTTLDQSGRVEVQSGMIGLGGASSSDGEYVTETGTEIAFLYGTHVWNEGVTVTGDGIIALRNLTGSLAATLDVAAARIDVPRLDLRVLATLTGTGTVALTGTESEWTGGFMTGGGTTRIETGAVLTVSGSARKYLGDRTIDVQGTLVESSSGDLLDLEGAATLDVAGNMDIRVDTAWQDYTSRPGTLVVNNTGSILKSAGTGQFEFLHTALNNTGLVHAKAGQLAFGGDGGVSIGEFRADSGTDIAFLYGTQTWNDGAKATGAGTLSLRNLSGSLGGTLSVNGTTVTAERLNLGPLGTLTGTGLFTITGTGSRWTAGFMTGGGTTRIDTGADLTLAGGSRKFLGTRTLDVRGTLVEDSTGDLLDLEGAATLNVSGTFDIRGDTAWQHFTSAPGTLAIGNTGVIRKSAGAGTFEFLNSSLTNTGTVEVTAGTLRFSAPVVQNGQVTVGAGATLILGAQTILGPFPTPPAPPAPLAAPDTSMQTAAAPDPAAMVAAGQAPAVPETAAPPLVLQVARPSTSLGTSAARAAAEDETPASVGIRLNSLLSGSSAVDWRKDFRQALRLLRWLR